MTVVAIHQPQYLPYLGFFHKIAHSDVFVVLDDVQFQKGGFQNRNRIKTSESWQWLTVPVLQKSEQLIKDVRINQEVPWQRKHWSALTTNYASATYFEDYSNNLQPILHAEWKALSDLNFALMQWVMEVLHIDTPIERSSTMGVAEEGTSRLIRICQKLNASRYLSGPGGKSYMDLDAFRQSSIDVIWQDFNSPVYQQQFPETEFVADLSVLDALFNCGPDTTKLLE